MHSVLGYRKQWQKQYIAIRKTDLFYNSMGLWGNVTKRGVWTLFLFSSRFITNGVSDACLTSFLKSYLAYPHNKFLISRVAFYFKSFVLKIPLSLQKQNQSDFILYFPEHSAYQSRHCPYLDTIDRYSVANCWIFFDHVCNKLPHS